MRPPRWIRYLQYLTMILMWTFCLAILIYVPWLVFVAARLHDALNWSIAIAIVMTPIFVAVCASLTYVFLGLRKHMPKE